MPPFWYASHSDLEKECRLFTFPSFFEYLLSWNYIPHTWAKNKRTVFPEIQVQYEKSRALA